MHLLRERFEAHYHAGAQAYHGQSALDESLPPRTAGDYLGLSRFLPEALESRPALTLRKGRSGRRAEELTGRRIAGMPLPLMESQPPLVSCIMPTFNRRGFVP